MSRRPWLRPAAMLGGGLLALALAVSLWVLWRNLHGEAALVPDAPPAAAPDAALLARGAYLAKAGNCAGCHTARGGAPYAGGRAIATPFGTVYAGNLTPDASGLGGWTAAQFRRALWHGRSADGRLLVPAFPYTHYTLVTRADADALWAHLRSLPPVAQANRPHALRWPYGSQAALAVWRALFFSPQAGNGPALATQAAVADAVVQRGAYLVNGLGHCSACHGSRNMLGGSGALGSDGGGSAVPGQRWQAPSLTDPQQLAMGRRSASELVQLLKTGLSDQAAVMGPMAEVVADSTQHLSDADLQAMVAYLQSLAPKPGAAAPRTASLPPGESSTLDRGRQLYADQCVDCHGPQGQGAPGAYPALAGNPIVTLPDATNLVQAIIGGGFAPATAGNPRPYGMPPYDLPHDDLAALATWLRASWGHDAAPVSAVQVLLAR
ncbi:MAG: c-type cytochrome [Aquabacterium sp.]|nr:c-type cytochrome [Aquabacterium sp.]